MQRIGTVKKRTGEGRGTATVQACGPATAVPRMSLRGPMTDTADSKRELNHRDARSRRVVSVNQPAREVCSAPEVELYICQTGGASVDVADLIGLAIASLLRTA
jgi:hypothetical protein